MNGGRTLTSNVGVCLDRSANATAHSDVGLTLV